MTLNELRYVVAVARERHFGHAAEACFVSQPTLSVAVRKLEDELGVTLFERGPGEVTVTAVGREVIEQAQRVLEEAEGVRRVARHGQNPLAGPLRLGAIYTVGPYLLPHLIPLAMERAPDMPLVIEESFTTVLAERLKRGDLDLIIISLPFDEAGVLTRPLYDEEFVVLMPISHPWQARASIDIADLGEASVLLLGPGIAFATRSSTPVRGAGSPRPPVAPCSAIWKAARWRPFGSWSRAASGSPCCHARRAATTATSRETSCARVLFPGKPRNVGSRSHGASRFRAVRRSMSSPRRSAAPT